MKIFGFLLLTMLVLQSCDDKDSASKSLKSQSHHNQVDVNSSSYVPAITFKCTDKCNESYIAIYDANSVCTGVVFDNKLLVASSCLAGLEVPQLKIQSSENKFYTIKDIDYGVPISKITTNENIDIDDITLTDSNYFSEDIKAQYFTKEDNIITLNDSRCELTFSSIYALESTRVNSQILALKECDNLPIGSIILSNDEFLGISISSSEVNKVYSFACNDNCSSEKSDKLEFLIKEITEKTKVKHLRKLINQEENENGISINSIQLEKNNLVTKFEIVCAREEAFFSDPSVLFKNEFNKYGEILSSIPELKADNFYYFSMNDIVKVDDKLLTKIFGLNIKNKGKNLINGIVTNKDITDFDENESYFTKTISIKKCKDYSNL